MTQLTLTKHHGLGNDFLVVFSPGVDDLPALAAGRYELVVAKEIVKANIHLQPIYDSLNQRVKS